MKFFKKKIGLLLSAALVLLNTGCQRSTVNTSKVSPTKVILDCDMWYMNDDALCLSMLLQAEKIGKVEILGITLCGGNTFIDSSYQNYGTTQYGSSKYTYDFLKEVNRSDIPYYRGTDYPTNISKDELKRLDTFYKNLNYIKGQNGYGAIHFFDEINPDELCDSDDAADFMIKSVRDNPGEIVIFAIGPTMNIAKAIQKDKNFAANVKSIYYMGGAFGDSVIMENIHSEQVEGIDGANLTPVSEYNVFYDPVAFDICISAPFQHQYILPGSCNVSIDKTTADKFINATEKSEIIELWANHFREVLQDYPFWDALTVYSFLCPEKIQKSSVKYVTVNTNRDSADFGRTYSYNLEEYEQLDDEYKTRCGKAEIIFETADFWDYALELFSL